MEVFVVVIPRCDTFQNNQEQNDKSKHCSFCDKTFNCVSWRIRHEITHTVSFRFLDAGHGTPECPDAELVSYGIGNLVAKMWREK